MRAPPPRSRSPEVSRESKTFSRPLFEGKKGKCEEREVVKRESSFRLSPFSSTFLFQRSISRRPRSNFLGENCSCRLIKRLTSRCKLLFIYFFNNSTIVSASYRSLLRILHSKTRAIKIFTVNFWIFLRLFILFYIKLEYIKECRDIEFHPLLWRKKGINNPHTSTSFHWRVYWISHSVARFIFTSYYYVFL